MQTIHVRPCPGCGGHQSRTEFEEPPFVLVKCSDCSTVFLANPPSEDQLYDEYYSSVEPQPDEYRASSPNELLQELFAINTQRVKRITQLKPSGRLLDVGCGRGYFLKSAEAEGYDAFGVDVSEKAVTYAREQFGLHADVRSMDDLIAAGEEYDVITLWHVLEHFADPLGALEAIRTLLKPGGLCVIEVPNLHSLKFMISSTKWEGGNHPLYHRTFFTASTLRNVLQKSGFSPVHRMRWSYSVPGRNILYEGVKRALNVFALDAFLNAVAWKPEDNADRIR